MRVCLSVLAAALALGTSGCWMAALQLAPVALQAAEGLGSGVLNMAAAASEGHHSAEPGKTPAEQEERCDELEIEVPGVIEFRIDKATHQPQWREVQLGGSMDAPQWEPIIEQDTAPGGWHQAMNLAKMSFSPPLEGALGADAANFIAYAPANPRTSIEEDQLVAMTVDFGAGIGVFQWRGRTYQYSVVHKLPCYPISVALSQ